MELSPQVVAAIITFIVGGGLVGLITQIVRGVGSLRQGARTSTREVIRDLAAARDESEMREEIVRNDMEYWRRIAADYGFQLRTAGLEPRPAIPRPPSDPLRKVSTLRGRRAARAPSTEEIQRVAEEDEG
jgi:hypothetical protein